MFFLNYCYTHGLPLMGKNVDYDKLFTVLILLIKGVF